jgi:hypothetical protein
MDDSVIRLFPLPSEERPLKGLFLADDLQQYCRQSGRPFVYSDYVAIAGNRAGPLSTAITWPAWTAGSPSSIRPNRA